MKLNPIKQITLVAVFTLLLTGCSSTSETRKKLSAQLHSQMTVQKEAINNTPTKEAAEKAAAIHQIETKVAIVEDLQKDFEFEKTKIENRLNALTGNANRWGYESIVIKRAGLLAGIAAAALVAASPANAVWVAGFSGFAGAANGYAAASGSEGFSKAAVAAFLKPVIQKVNAIAETFSTDEAQLYLWQEKDNEKFIAAVAKQRVTINKLAAAGLELLQPVTAIEPDLKQKEELLTEIKKRDDIIESQRQQIKATKGN